VFEQIVKGALWFAVATYAIGTFKTLTLALAADGGQSAGQILVKEEGRKPLIYPVIDGTDMAMPFATAIQTASRVVGTSKLYYAVYPGMSVRDTRYRAFWR
jgi:hypothetical protein